MSQVCFEGISQQKQHDFYEKTRFSNSMNLLGKPHRNMTEYLLNPLANTLFIGGFPWLVRMFTVAFTLNPQVNLLTFRVKLFLFVVRVACIAKYLATPWQGQIHHLQGRHIHIRAGQNEELHRLLVAGGDQLHSKAKEESAFGGNHAPVGFAFNQVATADTDGWPLPCYHKRLPETNQSNTHC